MSAPVVLSIAPVFLLSGGAAAGFIGLAVSAERARSSVIRRSASSRSAARPHARRASAAYDRYQPKPEPATAPPRLMLEAATCVRPTAEEVNMSNVDGTDADVIDLSEMFADRAKSQDPIAA